MWDKKSFMAWAEVAVKDGKVSMVNWWPVDYKIAKDYLKDKDNTLYELFVSSENAYNTLVNNGKLIVDHLKTRMKG